MSNSKNSTQHSESNSIKNPILSVNKNKILRASQFNYKLIVFSPKPNSKKWKLEATRIKSVSLQNPWPKRRTWNRREYETAPKLTKEKNLKSKLEEEEGNQREEERFNLYQRETKFWEARVKRGDRSVGDSKERLLLVRPRRTITKLSNATKFTVTIIKPTQLYFPFFVIIKALRLFY